MIQVKYALSCFILFSGECAKRLFQNLRNRYARDKKKLQKARKSGTGTESVKEVENGVHYMYHFLKWLDPYVVSRQSSSNLVDLTSTEEDNAESDSENDNSSVSGSHSPPSPLPSNPEGTHCSAVIKNEEVISKVTGNPKYTKRAKTKENPLDKAELEVMKSLSNRLNDKEKKVQQQQKDEESMFCKLIATQLRQLPHQERTVAMMEINSIVYNHLLRNMHVNHFVASESPLGHQSHASTFTLALVNPQPHLPTEINQMTGNSEQTFFEPGHFFRQAQQHK